MTGREAYEITREQLRGAGYPAPAWDALDRMTRFEWDMKALELTESEHEQEHEALGTLDNREDR